MPGTRRAIYLPPSGNHEVISQSAVYVPTGSQVLVRVSYSAVNPADKKHFYMGWHSFVAGYEWLGTVEAAGPGSPYAVGERLFGLTSFGHQRPIEIGAHQDLILAETGTGSCTYRVPKGLGNEDLKQLVAWPSALQTTIDALFNCLGFAFPPTSESADVARIDGIDPKGRAILIWGGSSAVGLGAIYFASQAGFSPIYTTASSKNHETLLSLGATQCFDYRSPTVVDEIRSAVAGSPNQKLSVVFDAVTTGTGLGEPEKGELDLSKSSPALAVRCLTDGANAEDLRLCSSLPVPNDPRWKLCLARRDPKESPQLAESNRRMEAGMAWALNQLTTSKGSFRLPKIRVVKGAEEGIQAINDVFYGKYSMEKLVIQHPL
ncbi:hypothetical protein HD806DRAFT_3325 [Xylariaceae sp. AK1471]|nr:hypothetical protein HD806DRAFT_3325 [Xylariaceae sp. AK1471]